MLEMVRLPGGPLGIQMVGVPIVITSEVSYRLLENLCR